MVSTTLGDRVRGDKNLGADPILRFLALLDWMDEAKVAELRAERSALGAYHASPVVTATSRPEGTAANGAVRRGA
jgi:hypothetical protein